MSQVASTAAIMAVIQQIVADHTAYTLAVEIDNRKTVDQVLQDQAYLQVEIKYLSGGQMDMADRPHVEQWGQIWLTAVCKEGEGTAAVRALSDFILPYFDRKVLASLVVCKTVTSGTPKLMSGLWKAPSIVNFYYHRLTN